MKAQHSNPSEIREKLAFLTKDYMPEARWTIDGAFRFGFCVYRICGFFASAIPVRKVDKVSGSPPCLWSLDWFSQRRPLLAKDYIQQLESYTSAGMGVTLVFDNPFIKEEELHDDYALFLVRELSKRNAAHMHAVCVASDLLAEHLRRHVPALPIYCHMNRLVVEPTETVRDAHFYNRLAQQYNRVCLHPADAVNPAVYTAIKEPARMDVVINDSCLRDCSARREHLQILANYRRNPYAPIYGRQREELLNRVGCLKVDGSCLQQKKMGNLTKAESRALYAAGYRSFIIQSQQFRTEATLMWDVVQNMFASSPELSHKIALITSWMTTTYSPISRSLSSGLGAFTYFDYD